jgi:hypothetical protein
MSQVIEKTIGYFELVLCLLAIIISASAIRPAFFPPDDIHWEAPSWAFLIFSAFAPLSVLLGIAGVSFVKNFRFKWIINALLIGVILGLILFFRSIDKA